MKWRGISLLHLQNAFFRAAFVANCGFIFIRPHGLAFKNLAHLQLKMIHKNDQVKWKEIIMIKPLEIPKDPLLLPQEREGMYPQPIDEDKPARKVELKRKTAVVFGEECENLLHCLSCFDD